jgi:XRE family transcriptional regulator of biofilm formation
MAKMTTTGVTPIGDVILAWRKFRGFNSTKLADKAGVRLSYLSEIEHNRTVNPREEYLEKLALALEVPLEDILGRRMPPVNGEASGSQQGGGAEGSQKGASQSTVFNTPLAIKRQKILMHRLEIAEKKLEAVGKMLSDLHEEIREIGALVADLQSEE